MTKSMSKQSWTKAGGTVTDGVNKRLEHFSVRIYTCVCVKVGEKGNNWKERSLIGPTSTRLIFYFILLRSNPKIAP